MTFEGFDPVAVATLADLPEYSADDYAAARERLTAGLTRPGLALLHDLAARLEADLTVDARRSVSPLHRDLRFAKPGAPRYKDHLLLTMWHGADKRSAPTLWMRIDAERVGFASGIGFNPHLRTEWRAAVGGPQGERLVAALDALSTHRAEVAGEQTARVPRPFDADHPRADLLRRTGFQVRYTDPLPAAVDRPAFVDWSAARLASLLPVHHWLVNELTEG